MDHKYVVMSMFNDATSYLDRYFRQVDSLRSLVDTAGDTLRCIWAEGDSSDDSYGYLLERAPSGLEYELLEVSHGNTVYKSIESPDRFAQLSRIWNLMLAQLREDDDTIILVESDLIWSPFDIAWLIQTSLTCNAIAAGWVFLRDRGEWFYDTWAYRKDGKRFTHVPPYFHPYDDRSAPIDRGVVEIDSAGSCLVFPAEIGRKVSVPAENELVGFCDRAREYGYSVLLDTRATIRHP